MIRGGVRALAPVFVGVFIALGLAGCVPSPNSTDLSQTGLATTSAAPAARGTAAPTPFSDDEQQAGSTGSPAATDGCGPPTLYEAWSADKPLRATLGGNRLRVPVDLGARANASGEAMLDDEGRPVAYIVASGDLRSDVADRFCIDPYYMDAMNQIRRDVAFELYVGDTLNLSPYTVTSVGSENGEVFDNPAPDPLPSQRQP